MSRTAGGDICVGMLKGAAGAYLKPVGTEGQSVDDVKVPLRVLGGRRHGRRLLVVVLLVRLLKLVHPRRLARQQHQTEHAQCGEVDLVLVHGGRWGGLWVLTGSHALSLPPPVCIAKAVALRTSVRVGTGTSADVGVRVTSSWDEREKWL